MAEKDDNPDANPYKQQSPGQSLRDAIRGLRGKSSADSGSSSDKFDELFPISAAQRKTSNKEEPQPTEDQICHYFEGKGVFIGIWSPVDRDGRSLGQTFNLYAAPRDLTDKNWERVKLTFNDAVNRVAELENWYGHNGFDHGDGSAAWDAELYGAIRENSYHGEWFIPTRDIWYGVDLDGKKRHDPPLFELRGKGALKDTFFAHFGGAEDDKRYWCCTQVRDEFPLETYILRRWDGWALRDSKELPTRLVRAEPKIGF